MRDLLRPDLCFNGVADISFDKLLEKEVKYILLDLDNTLINMYRELEGKIIEWVNLAKKKGFQLYILSNTNKIDKVSTVATKLDIPYIHSARKPFKKGFKKAIKEFNIEPKYTAMVGDQLFTDVIGGNVMNMISIYVNPISKKEHWYTSWKRPIEACFLKKYQNM